MISGDSISSKCKPTEELCATLPAWLDHSSYISLNRFWGRRYTAKLAELNAVFLDLDFHTHDKWQGATAPQLQAAFETALQKAGIPLPSITLHTGRGVAVIWLIKALPPEALKRWQGAMQAAIKFGAAFGADPACSDAARVFRLPGTINEKSKKEVLVAAATGERYCFDRLADAFYVAVGQPTRAELKKAQTERARQAKPTAARKMPKGLSSAERFSQIMQDLETIRQYYGGYIPEGMRNTWLHLYAVCLTHCAPHRDSAPDIQFQANNATPGLSPREIEGIIRNAERCIERGVSTKYFYKGCTIADLLHISARLAEQLHLLQVMPVEEHARRAALAEENRRRARGSECRDKWLLKNNREQLKPWEDEGMSRASWYRRRKDRENVEEPVKTQEAIIAAPVRLDRCRNKGNRRFLERDEHLTTQNQRAAQKPACAPTRIPVGKPEQNRNSDRKAQSSVVISQFEPLVYAAPPLLRDRTNTSGSKGSDLSSESRSKPRRTEKAERRSCHQATPSDVALKATYVQLQLSRDRKLTRISVN